MSAIPSCATFRILTVCTGNICRSPYAARLLQAAFARHGLLDGIEVVSAGTRAMCGAPVAPEMALFAANSGVDVSGHVARQLNRRNAETADLILALTRAHRRDSALLVPAKSRVSFTLKEFARLAEDAHAARLLQPRRTRSAPELMSTFVGIVASRRGFAVPPEDPAEDDVLDPYGQDDYAFVTSADHIARAVDRIERVVSGVAA